MVGLIPPNDLTAQERLCLLAGQLAFPGPGKEARAIGLALAMLAEPFGDNGLIGEGRLPDTQTLRATAEEVVHDLDFSGRKLVDAMEVLRVAGFLECDHLDIGERYVIRPSTLPQRRTHLYDRPETSQLLGRDVDTYGFGAD